MRLPPWLVLMSVLLWASSVSLVHAGNNVWTSLGLAVMNVLALAIDPSTPTTLYVGTLHDGVFKSTDGGSSWSAVNTGLPNVPAVPALAIDPLTPTTLYAGTGFVGSRPSLNVGGVFKSTDGGSSWSAINAGLFPPGVFATSVFALAIDPRTPTTLYAGIASTGRGGVFKSIDGGSSWNAVNAGLPNFVAALAIDPLTPTTLYVGAGGDGVFKSIDGGSSWNAVNAGLPSPVFVSALALDPRTPTTLYAGIARIGRDGVFAITFGGLTLNLNQPTFRMGDQLILHAQVIPEATPVTADVYIALQPPGCTTDACLLFWQGGFNFTTTPQPLLPNWPISSFNGPIFSYTFGGTEPVGTYAWLGAFVVPGTVNLLGGITQAPFTFRP